MNETEKAIEVIKDVTRNDNGRHYGEIDKARNLAISALEKQLNNGWIPCSERLPSKEEYQRNDCRFIVTDGNRIYEDSFDYMADGYTEPKWTYSACQVIAWQPLPEPYKVSNET